MVNGTRDIRLRHCVAGGLGQRYSSEALWGGGRCLACRRMCGNGSAHEFVGGLRDLCNPRDQGVCDVFILCEVELTPHGRHGVKHQIEGDRRDQSQYTYVGRRIRELGVNDPIIAGRRDAATRL